MNRRPKVVLVHPEIPGNTGSIGRTCVALDFELILIKPLAFDLDEKAVRRAGLDYWKYVKLKIYENWEEFLATENPEKSQMFFFSKGGSKRYFDCHFSLQSYLVFGAETKGLPAEILKENQEQICTLPMFSDKIRSLNLANTATAACYEVVRQLFL